MITLFECIMKSINVYTRDQEFTYGNENSPSYMLARSDTHIRRCEPSNLFDKEFGEVRRVNAEIK